MIPLFLRIAAWRYPARYQPVAVVLAGIALAVMALAVVQYQRGPMVPLPYSVPRPVMQLCQSVDSHGNGTLYTSAHC